jgi:hypothetical protein
MIYDYDMLKYRPQIITFQIELLQLMLQIMKMNQSQLRKPAMMGKDQSSKDLAISSASLTREDGTVSIIQLCRKGKSCRRGFLIITHGKGIHL